MRIASILVMAAFVHAQGFAQAPSPTQPRPATQPVKKRVPQKPTSPIIGMTNADVIKMVTAGFSEDLVIKAIRSAAKRNFDLSVDALLALKNAKVSEPVIGIMMNPAIEASASVRAGPEPRLAAVAERRPPVRTSIAIADGTEIKLRLQKPLTSATAKVDDSVEFEALTDLVVDSVLVAPKGATAVGTVTVAESKKSFGRQGRLDFSIDFLKVVNGQNVRLRTIKETKAGGNGKSGMRAMLMPIGSLMKGNELVVAAGTEYAAYVDGDRSITLDESRTTDAKTVPVAASVPAPSPSATPVAPVAPGAAPRREMSHQNAEWHEPTGTSGVKNPSENVKEPSRARTELTKDDRNQLEKELESMYEMSHVSFMDTTKVDKPGGIYAVNADSIQGQPAIGSDNVWTYVLDGKVLASADRGAGKLLGNILNGQKVETTKLLKKGERVYITGFKAQSDGLLLHFYTVDTTPIVDRGRTRQSSYKGTVMFTGALRGGISVAFPAVSNAVEMKQLIARVFVSETEALAPKNIELGQTIEQIEQILGKPTSIVKLGVRTIYTYKDMKIVFTDGKVSDVQ